MPVRNREASSDRGEGSAIPTEETAFRQAAAAALIVTGLIHAYFTCLYLLYGAHFGILFGAAVIACAWSALLLLRRNDTVAWTVAAAVWVGLAVLFALSRTIGLYGFKGSDGTALLMAEGEYLLVWIQRALVKRRGNATTRRP
jgi:hypothetical protein